MSKVVAFLARTEPQVVQMAVVLGAILDEPVELIHISRRDEAARDKELGVLEGQEVRLISGPLLATAQRVIAEEGVSAAVFGMRQDRREGAPSALLIAVLAWSATPIVVVPQAAVVPQPGGLRRVLVPLDGTADSTAAVAAAKTLLAGDTGEVVPLHVFDQTTVPTFWDQPQHEATVWSEEFVRRTAPDGGAPLELRAGDAAAAVLEAATARRADVLVLAWRRTVEPGRAKVVRQVLAEAHIPVVLLPRGE